MTAGSETFVIKKKGTHGKYGMVKIEPQIGKNIILIEPLTIQDPDVGVQVKG